MEFNKDAFCYDQEQQQQQQMFQGTFLFSSSSSSSVSPSSTSSLTHHHHQRNLREAQIYGTSHQSSGGGWGGYGSNSYNRFVRTSSSHHQAAEQSSMSCYDDIVVPMENDQNEDVDMEEKNQSLALAHQQRVEEIEKEHMFDKVVTPSDVGKLNRLVIPKQHAEKYFPLDSSTNEKGLLLNFEDRSGKPWRFRYSYWNSSQSYVMTKGWSRFVKEKKLDAGDVVSFQRGIGELGKDRLYIDWRRRPNAAPPPDHSSLPLHNNFPFTRTMPWTTTQLFMRQPAGPPAGGSPLVAPMFRDHHSSHLPHHHHQIPPPTNSINFHYNASTSGDSYINFNRLPMTSERPLLYYRSSPQEIGMLQLHQPHYHNQDHGGVGGIGGVEVEPMVLGSVPVVHGKAAAKRLRLFGVNMDCPISSEECEILSSTTIPPGGAVVIPSPHHHHHYNHQQQPSPSSSSSLAQFQLQRFYNGTPVSNKGKGSLSLDLDI